MIDLYGKPSQKEFGELVGISQPAVSDLLARQILPRDGCALKMIQAYCANLREVAAGRATNGDIELATERAKLAREQRIKLEMANAVTRRELAPTVLLTDILAATGAKVSRILESIPGKLRRLNDKLTASDVKAVEVEIAKCRNQIAAMRLAEGEFVEDGEDESIAMEGDEG